MNTREVSDTRVSVESSMNGTIVKEQHCLNWTPFNCRGTHAGPYRTKAAVPR